MPEHSSVCRHKEAHALKIFNDYLLIVLVICFILDFSCPAACHKTTKKASVHVTEAFSLIHYDFTDGLQPAVFLYYSVSMI